MNTSTHVHDVDVIQIEDTSELFCGGHAFYTRKITLKTQDGSVEIVAFSDDAKKLVAKSDHGTALRDKLSEVLDHWIVGTNPERYAPLVAECRELIGGGA